MIKVLVVGSGGREHALVWKLTQSHEVGEIYAVPGNGGICKIAECFQIDPLDFEALIKLVEEKNIDLTIAGSEIPLAAGIVDEFEKKGLRIFGPSKNAAKLEGSKVFCKELLWKYGIPTGGGKVFSSMQDALNYLGGCNFPKVVKADGLAAGKGVIVCKCRDEAVRAVEDIMGRKIFGPSGDKILIEEFLDGEEVSFLIFTDGETVIPLVSSQDHKAVFDGDKGPNTGGMGAYSPVSFVTPKMEGEIIENIIKPVVRAMKEEGNPYRGVLYAGLMITDEGPKVLEFNVRFGDPETQSIIPLLKTDLLVPVNACIDGRAGNVSLDWNEGAAVCVVLTSKGYPGKYEKGKEIKGLEGLSSEKEIHVFHAGTVCRDGVFITSGGRVLGVTGIGSSIKDAVENTYRAVQRINFDGIYYRKDIGAKGI